MNTGVHVFFRMVSSSRIAGSYDTFIPSFLRNFHTVLHSGCYQFTFLPTVQEGSLFFTSSAALFIDFLMMAISTGVR